MAKTDTPAPAESPLNPDLEKLHDMLVSKVADLNSQIGTATTSDAITAIVREIDEVNHRVTLVGNLLFTQQTAKITAAMERVTDAEGDVDDAIKAVDDLTGFIKGKTAFLGLVDKAIDTAKLVL